MKMPLLGKMPLPVPQLYVLKRMMTLVSLVHFEQALELLEGSIPIP